MTQSVRLKGNNANLKSIKTANLDTCLILERSVLDPKKAGVSANKYAAYTKFPICQFQSNYY